MGLGGDCGRAGGACDVIWRSLRGGQATPLVKPRGEMKDYTLSRLGVGPCVATDNKKDLIL